MGCNSLTKCVIFTLRTGNEGQRAQASERGAGAPHYNHHKLKVGKRAKIAYNRIGEMGTIAPHYL